MVSIVNKLIFVKKRIIDEYLPKAKLISELNRGSIKPESDMYIANAQDVHERVRLTIKNKQPINSITIVPFLKRQKNIVVKILTIGMRKGVFIGDKYDHQYEVSSGLIIDTQQIKPNSIIVMLTIKIDEIRAIV